MLWAGWVHQQNINYLTKTNKQKIWRGMVSTADDASYQVPVENFIEKGVWKDRTQGVSSYIQRPPGMGIVHGIFLVTAPEKLIFLQKIFNLLLHAIGLYLFGLIAWKISGNKKIAVVAQVVYALLPCFWGYLSYQITESITPSLIIILLYGYTLYPVKKNIALVLQAITGGFLLLIRPQLGIFLLPFIFFLVKTALSVSSHERWKIPLLFLVCFGGFFLWQARSYHMAGRYTSLHPIYHETNNTLYRPVHRSLGELFKVWEYNSERFHTTISMVLEDAVTNGKGSMPSPDFTREMDLQGCSGIRKEKLQQLLIAYKKTIGEHQFAMNSNEQTGGETPGEKTLRAEIYHLTSQLKKKNPVLYYIKTPARSFTWMFTKSQLNLALFQQKYRGETWMELLRYICVALICISLLTTLLTLFKPVDSTWFLFSLCMLAYLFYLFFFQRMNEERYLVPLLGPMFLTQLPFIRKLFSYKKTAYSQRNMP